MQCGPGSGPFSNQRSKANHQSFHIRKIKKKEREQIISKENTNYIKMKQKKKPQVKTSEMENRKSIEKNQPNQTLVF